MFSTKISSSFCSYIVGIGHIYMHSRYAPDQRPVWCYAMVAENNSWQLQLWTLKCTLVHEKFAISFTSSQIYLVERKTAHISHSNYASRSSSGNYRNIPQRDRTRKIYWPVKSRMEARSVDRQAAVIDIGPTARINQLNFSASRWHYSLATLASRASVCDEFLRAICDAWVAAWWSMPTTIYGHDSKMRTSRWCRNVDFWKWENLLN